MINLILLFSGIAIGLQNNCTYNGMYEVKSGIEKITICKSVDGVKKDKQGLYKTLMHEFGHRYYYKFMTEEQRQERHNLYKGEKIVILDGGYYETDEYEYFAEVFAYYYLHKIVDKKYFKIQFELDNRKEYYNFVLKLDGKEV